MNILLNPTRSILRLTFLILIIFSSQSLRAQLPAFPSAYGAGAYTTGGRGGEVIHVTNLNDSGPGSLREALQLKVTRIIVFDVSGVIDLKSLLYVGGNGNFTIAGQTAPEGGITLDGQKVYFSSLDNIIVRHIRIKGGIDADLIPNSGDKKGNSSLSVVGNMTNQIWDHVSFAFGEDETAEWYDTGNHDLDKVTIQKCFIAEGRKGGIFGKLTGRTGLSGNLSYINNLFYNAGYRFPNVSGDGIKIDLINNAAWTTTGRLVRGSGSYNLNHIGNYYDYGNYPIYDKTIHLHSEGTVPKIYTANNKIIAPYVSRNKLTSTVAEMNADNTLSWKYFVGDRYGVQLPPTHFTSVQRPLNGRAFTIVDAETAFENAVNDIGCNARLNADGGVSDNTDVLDADWINQISLGNYIPKLPQSKYIVPHIPSVSRSAKFYINNPHIPEVWFAANVPNGQDHNDIAPSGYTWLEEYLNQVDRPKNVVAVQGVKVTPEEADLEITKTLQLSATFAPADATNQNGKWTSSDEDIVTVDANGLVTAVSVGEVEITFISADGGAEGKSEITVFPAALQASAGIDQQICKGESTTLTASGGTNYVWSTGETTESIEVAPETTTTYTVMVLDDNDQSEEANVTVTVNDVPIANAGDDQIICVGESTKLIASGGTSYLWSSGETTASIEVSPMVETIYTVEVSIGNCSSTDEIIIFVNEAPELTITEDLVINPGESTTLTVSGSDNYEWNSGETTPSITVSPELTTTYSVSSFSSNGCKSIVSVTVTVALEVVADAGADQSICAGSSTTLTAEGGSTYLWDTGATTASITVSPSATATYSVTAYDSTGNNSDTDEVQVTVNALPIVDAGKNITINSGESTTLKATGANNYKWNTGATNASITVSPKATRTYTVTGNINGCEATDTVKVIVLNTVEIIADAGSDQSICAGSSTTLTATGGSTYLWNTGATTASITVSPSATTTYSVTAYDSTGNSSDTDEVKVTVNKLPIVDAGNNITINSGESTTLTATGATTYKWNTGATSESITVSPTTTMTYTVTGTTNGCEATDIVKIIVIKPVVVVANAGKNQDICQGANVVLTATGGDTYLWSTGAKTESITVNPKSTAKFSVTAYIGNASDTAEVVVYVNPNPDVTITNGSEASILEGEFITLSATGAKTYKWDNGATQPNIAVRPNKTKSYDVTGYDNDCYSQKSITVNVFEKVVASAGDDVAICLNGNTILTAKGPANSEYLWSTGETTKSIKVEPTEDTEYSVMVYHALDSDTDNVMVKVTNCEEVQILEDDSVALEFLIHPNPTDGELNIKVSGLTNLSSIHLYDLSGKSLYNEIINDNDQNRYDKTLNLSDYASGIYLLQLVDNQRVITKKVILR